MTAHSGRGNVMPEAVVEQLLQTIAGGVSATRACELAGWNPRTLTRWAGRTADNAARYTEALAAGAAARAIDPAARLEARRRRDRERQAAYRRRVAAEGFATLTHGGVGTYSAGCRCLECRRANTEACSRRRARRAAAA